jgi:hypothetical protein
MASGRVFRPPYAGARAISEWAVDLWPYVNGKAIVNGLRLPELDMSDMLDVMHFFMEEDFSQSSTAEQSEAKDKARELIYSSLYNRKYTLARKNKDYQTANSSGEFYEDEIVPVDPLKEPTKSYVPATDFNPNSPKPFGDLLDAPIGQ